MRHLAQFRVLGIVIICLLCFGWAGAAENQQDKNGNSNGKDGNAVAAKQESNNFKVEFSIRNRLDSLVNRDFNSSIDDSYCYLRQRYCMFFNYKAGEVPLFSEVRFVRQFPEAFNSLELQQLYMDIGKDFRFRIGRQMMMFGDGRVISTRPLSDTGVVFDGLRMTASEKYFSTELLALNRSQYHWQAPGQERLYGFYSMWRKDKTEADGYFLTKEMDHGAYDGGLRQIRAAGVRFKQEKKDVVYGFEGIHQFGVEGARQRDAWAFVTYGNYTFNRTPWKPTVGFNFDYFSGDSNPNDGVMHTFDDFYQRNQNFLGNIGLIGPKNVKDFGILATVQPHPDWFASANYHFFTLDKPQDAWYGISGRPIFWDPKGRSGIDMGRELDTYIRYKKKIWDIYVGYCVMNPGEFIKNSNKGRTDPAQYFYFQVENKF
ncbi:MAG: alginate export family protein [Firmicutes bacterium]|nr:alginate export family protein [Bacillota bacterium]